MQGYTEADRILRVCVEVGSPVELSEKGRNMYKLGVEVLRELIASQGVVLTESEEDLDAALAVIAACALVATEQKSDGTVSIIGLWRGLGTLAKVAMPSVEKWPDSARAKERRSLLSSITAVTDGLAGLSVEA